VIRPCETCWGKGRVWSPEGIGRLIDCPACGGSGNQEPPGLRTILEHDPDEGCDGCPLQNHAQGSDYCNVNVELEMDVPGLTTAPEGCPLRQGPITVRRP